ncbi:ankyrin repeat domain-containing protein 27-like [Lingula anatina]|uniref:Ankyrin repeat domain-containing protein 27-like n=1 Tax=Lingula anatina TaxID=7574 RepID=A0A2R2MT87_LINAN|nr:ankyrin repeat domain-containing protein 27-like [Lingula anatina]|eukprot:XP_023933480.1 ankyrin repeat domain-containing protein 27-like [Lingula anatina]
MQTGEGFSQKVTAKVLVEEKAYNKEYKPFKLLIVDQPLIPTPRSKRNSVLSNLIEIFTPKKTPTECREFLQSFPEHKQTLSNIDTTIQQFKKNYMVLKDYMDDAVKKIENICVEARQNLLLVNQHPHKTDQRFEDALSVAVESYILSELNSKVFPVVCQKWKKDDEHLEKKCQSLEGITGEQLGLKANLRCPLPSAVSEMSNLNQKCTPHEKLVCLKTVLDFIAEDINKHCMAGSQGLSGDNFLTSDDLIPLLVTVIIESKSSHLWSNLYYMEHFNWAMSTKDDLSFSLVTFKAAVEYLKTTKFEPMKKMEKEKQASKQNAQVTKPAGLPHLLLASPADKNSLPSGASAMDRQLEKITRMLEESTKEFASVGSQGLPRQGKGSKYRASPSAISPERQDRTEKLGEFLSALQDDMFGNSYGKQS